MEKLIGILKLMRWFHELLAVFPFIALFLVIKHFESNAGINCALNPYHFVLLCLCVQLLIAAGCVLNDIMDRDIDRVNKPNTRIIDRVISYKGAITLFVLLSAAILVLSIILSLVVFAEWMFIAIGVYLLSILYDVYLKRTPMLGNVFMGAITACIPLVLFFYAGECIEMIGDNRIEILIWVYCIFPFLIIIPRELSLDISDIQGDLACGCRTLPIMVGVKKSKGIIIGFLGAIELISLPIIFYFPYFTWTLIAVDLLLFIYLVFLIRASERIQYIRAGRLLWAIMIFGLIGFTVSVVI